MLPVHVEESRICVGDRFSVFFLRTLRVPEDGRTYPLPPGLGEFPIHRVEDYAGRVPPDWLVKGGVFIPLYQREALWLGFEAARWKPNAVKVGVGRVNAVSGADWDEVLHSDPQDYLVCPPQPWLDGINSGSGVVRQFVAAPLGLGDTIESQLTGSETGGLRLLVFEPRVGRFPDKPPRRSRPAASQTESVTTGAMGLSAGGKIQQKIYLDPYGLDAWDLQHFGSVWVHILNSEQYRAVTDLEPPPTPIEARTYTQYGFPWFQLYDEDVQDVPAAERLARVQGVRERQAARGEAAGTADRPVEVPGPQVRPLGSIDTSRSPENEGQDPASE
jgi:hypothetical protein